MALLEELRGLLALNDSSQAAWSSLVFPLALFVGLVITAVSRYATSQWRDMPPGPRGLPLIGNALQLKDEQWFRFSGWRKTYGGILSLSAMGQPIIVINDHAIATELLDRRAGKFSDRAPNIVGSEIMANGLMLPFSRYANVWRRMRKAAHEAVNKVVVHDLDEHLSSEALVLARDTLQNPSAWDDHLRRTAANAMLSSLYGEEPFGENDSRMDFVTAFNEQMTLSVIPGAYWVDILPWMRHIPSTFAPCKRTAEKWHRRADEFYLNLFERVQQRHISGNQQASFSLTLIQDANRYGLNGRENAWLTTSMFTAGSDTAAATMSWWSLAMMVHPETQKRAQDELDTVVGHARIPTFADKPHLPYITAIVKEIVRWRPVTPSGIGHRSTDDDVYEGYFIPKGTLIIPNVWEMNHDPELYGADASCFNPARYLDQQGQLMSNLPGVKDDGHFTFGFGRRICVGKHVANNSLFIEIATCLWAFSLTNVPGQKLDVNAFHDEGLVVRPAHFQVNVKPRFPEAITLLSHECEARGR